jgi:hypothetical protein
VIRTLHRVRGASALGARHPGELGPYGIRLDDPTEPDDGGGLDDEEQLLGDDQDDTTDSA